MARNPVQFQKGISLNEFLSLYGTEDLDALFQWRWPNGFLCPHCGHESTKAHLARELTVESFVENGEFETDIRNQVAIWHGGFLEAMVSVEKIIAWLSRL